MSSAVGIDSSSDDNVNVMLSLPGVDPTANSVNEADVLTGGDKPLSKAMTADDNTVQTIEPHFTPTCHPMACSHWCALSSNGSELLVVQYFKLEDLQLHLQIFDTDTGMEVSNTTREWGRTLDSINAIFIQMTTSDAADSAIVVSSQGHLFLLSRTGVTLDKQHVSMDHWCPMLRSSNNTFVVACSEAELWSVQQGKLVRLLALQITKETGFSLGHGCAASYDSQYVVRLNRRACHVWNINTHAHSAFEIPAPTRYEKGCGTIERHTAACIGTHGVVIGQYQTLLFYDLLNGACTASFDLEGAEEWGGIVQIIPLSDRHMAVVCQHRILQVDLQTRRTVRYFGPLSNHFFGRLPIRGSPYIYYQSGVIAEERTVSVYRLPLQSEHLQTLVDDKVLAHDVFSIPWLVIAIMEYLSAALPLTIGCDDRTDEYTGVLCGCSGVRQGITMVK